jgi:hypothetical protein
MRWCCRFWSRWRARDLVKQLEEELDRELMEEAMGRGRARATAYLGGVPSARGRGPSGAEAAARLGMKVATVFVAGARCRRCCRKKSGNWTRQTCRTLPMKGPCPEVDRPCGCLPRTVRLERSAVETHIETCASCQQVLARLTASPSPRALRGPACLRRVVLRWLPDLAVTPPRHDHSSPVKENDGPAVPGTNPGELGAAAWASSTRPGNRRSTASWP